MDPKLTFRFDREADVLYMDKVPPYADQETEELGDGLVARLNPETGDVENLEVLFVSTRLENDEAFEVPMHRATLRRTPA